jgi:hypothetical protein
MTQMKQIERQLRYIDGYERIQYKNHLRGLIKQSSVKSDIVRNEKVISLIDKIN